MRAILIFGIIVLALTGGISTAGTKYPLTVKDCRGKAITFTGEPKRIISLAPSNTEILFALGLESRIIGVTKFCDHPEAAKKKEKVGDRTTSVEKVVSLKPDLVLAHGMLNDDVLKALENHGLKTFAVDPKTLGQVSKDILTIGRITNREKEAAKITARISRAKAYVKRKVAGAKSKPKVLVAVQADPLWAAGPGTFIDEMISLAGGANVASDAKPGFNQFSAEAAAWRNPDVIIVTNKGDKQVFTKGLWKGVKAAQKGRVYEADPDLLVRPGPRLADGILAVARWIRPDVFGKN